MYRGSMTHSPFIVVTLKTIRIIWILRNDVTQVLKNNYVINDLCEIN